MTNILYLPSLYALLKKYQNINSQYDIDTGTTILRTAFFVKNTPVQTLRNFNRNAEQKKLKFIRSTFLIWKDFTAKNLHL